MRNKVPKRMLACLLALFICLGNGMPYVAADGRETQHNTIESSTDAEPIESRVDDGGVGGEETLEPALLLKGSMATGTFANAPPAGTDLEEIFVKIGNTDIDSEYPNVAIITYDEPDQCGAIWASKKLDLIQPFSTKMWLHLGHANGVSGDVADGITFTLHNDPDGIGSLGGRGEGLGVYSGRDADGEYDGTYLKNSLVIEFDTYNNNDTLLWSCMEDPEMPGYSAHCALIIPRDDTISASNHKNVFFFNSTQEWVLFDVEWTPKETGGVTGGTLTYSFGDSATMTYIIDDVADVFGGAEVYWGFTGATGSITALQAAAITKLPTQEFIAVKAVADSVGQDMNGKEARVGDTLRYTITVTAHETITGIGPVTVIDTLSSYVRYAGDATISLSTGGPPGVITPTISGSTLTFETNHILSEVNDWLEITFDIVVLESGAGYKIINAATVKADNLTEPQTTNSTEVNIKKVEKPAKPIGGDDDTYQVAYYANGGTGEHTATGFTYGSAHTVLSQIDTGIHRSDYIFRGWNTQSNGKGIFYNTGDMLTMTKNAALYAQWTQSPTTILDTENHFAYIIGYPDGSVGPEKSITRAEVATIFFRLLTREMRASMWGKENPYPDVNTGSWYNNAISTLTNGEILTGYPDGKFMPNSSITRAEFAAIAARFAVDGVAGESKREFNDIEGHWAEESIKLAAVLGYVEGYGDNTFHPDQPITRSEVATLLNRVLNRHVESIDDMIDGMVIWPDNNPGKWYYLAIQEATNAHCFDRKGDGKNEIWTQRRQSPDWTLLEKHNSKPEDIIY